MVVAADVARPGELVVEKEPTHQEEVGGVQHLIQSGGQAAVSLEESELSQRRLLVLRSPLRERRLQRIAPLVRSILRGQLQLGEEAIAERLCQVFLELLDQCGFANQRQQLAPSLAEETLGGLRRRFEVPLQVGELVPLDVVLGRGLDLATRNVRRDGVDSFLEAELVEREGRLLFREVDHEQTALLLHDGLERFDVGVGIDRERIGHARRQRHDPVQLFPALEDDKRPRARRLEALEEGLYLGEVVGHREPMRPRQAFDVGLAGFELPVTEAVEDTDEDWRIRSDSLLRGQVQIEGDDRALIGLAGDGLEVLAADERALSECRRERLGFRDLFGGTRHRTRRPGSFHSPFSLLERFPGACHRCSLPPLQPFFR